jgi:hypothetical protein
MDGLDDGHSFTTTTTTHVIQANSIPLRTPNDDTDDINTVILSQVDNASNKQIAVAISTTSTTLESSNKHLFYTRFATHKAAPALGIEGENSSVAIPFPPIRAEELHVQWHGEEYLDGYGRERDNVISIQACRGGGFGTKWKCLRGGCGRGGRKGEEEEGEGWKGRWLGTMRV